MVVDWITDWVFWSKWLPQFLYPLNLGLCLSIFALLAAWRGWHRLGAAFLSVSVATILIFSSPLSIMLYHHHETIYRSKPIAELPMVDAIVVLAGDVGIPVPPRQQSQLGGNRLLHAFRLFRAKKASLIIISGGNVFQQNDAESEAYYSREILQDWGVPPNQILIESGSRNTFENASNTKMLLETRRISRILLVTDALHMPRAFAVFQHTGIDVIASPSGYAVAEYRKPGLLYWWPKVENLMIAKRVIREKMGMVVYRWRGWVR